MMTETENLAEMIKQPDGVVFTVADDQEAGEKTPGKKTEVLTFDIESTQMKSETGEVKKKDDLVPVLDHTKGLKSNFQAESEEDLIKHTKYLYTRMEISVVITYWSIGQGISSFYQKEYGQSELKRIADEAGIHLDTLHKACKFAQEYSEDQVKELLDGKFTIAWNHIANNLSVEPQNLLDVYRSSNSPKEFHNGIIKFKSPNEKRGKLKKVNEEPDQNVSGPSQDPVEPEIIDNVKMEENQGEETAGESELIEALKDEINHLRDDLTSKDKRIKELERLTDKMSRELEEKEAHISSIKQGLASVRDMGDDGADRWAILEALEELNSSI